MNHSANKGRFRQILRLLVSALIPATLVACSGGGGGGGGVGGGDSVTPAATSFLSFGGGSLYLVNAQDFSDVRLVTSATVDEANTDTLYGTVFNATSGAYEVGDPTYVVYVADGRLYKKSLTDADAGAVQLSSVSTLAAICDFQAYEYPVDIEASPVFYSLPGPDGNCGGSNDTFLVSLDTPSTEAPRSIAVMPEMDIFDLNSGALRLVFLEGDIVRLYDHRYMNPLTVTSGVASIEQLYDLVGEPNYYLLLIDNGLHFIDVDGNLSSNLHSVAAGFQIADWRADVSNLYFFEENLGSPFNTVKGWRLPLDASTSATQFFEDSSVADPIDNIMLTTNKILLDQGDTITAIDKFSTLSALLTQVLVQYPTGSLMASQFTHEDKLYYTFFSTTLGRYDAFIIDESRNLLTYPRSAWIGATVAFSPADATSDLSHALLAEGYTGDLSTDGLKGAALRCLSLSDQSTIQMGTLERSGIPFYYNFLTGIGTNLDLLTFNRDVFALDAETGRFRFLTDTPDVDEFPVL